MENYREKIIELIRSQHLSDELPPNTIRLSEEVEYQEHREVYKVIVRHLFNCTFTQSYEVLKGQKCDINEVYARLWVGIQEYLKYYSKGQRPPHVIAAERYMNNIITGNADERGEFIH